MSQWYVHLTSADIVFVEVDLLNDVAVFYGRCGETPVKKVTPLPLMAPMIKNMLSGQRLVELQRQPDISTWALL